MAKLLGAILLVSLVGLFVGFSPALASSHPESSCPDGFSPHPAGHHSGQNHHGDHKHVGTDIDRNGDGWICAKHVGVEGSIHVHTDNNRP